jgi:CheY-like chemotaxis protein
MLSPRSGELAADHRDAALVDLRLAVVDGVAFVRRLRAQELCTQSLLTTKQ